MFTKKIIVISALAAIAFLGSCGNDNDSKVNASDQPIVLSTSPKTNDSNVAHNKVISVNFNKEMKGSTITSSSFSVKKGSSAVAGSITYSEKTVLFTPTAAFDQNTTYTVTLTTAVKSTKGFALSEDYSWKFTTGENSTGMSAVDLKSAAGFVILAKTAISNIPTTSITGDIGLSPAATSYITGFALTNATGYATSVQVTGKIYAADMVTPTSINLTVAVSDMIAAYNDAAGRLNPDFIELNTGNIGGRTLLPGLYKWTNTVTAPSNFVISGSANDVWIFQIAGDLDLSSGVKMTLSGGAKAENIFWQVAGEVSLGTSSDFKGNILSMTSVKLKTASTFTGRIMAQTDVVMDANTVRKL
ncbi:MAG: DUF3494 domain-containing protein [Flavobacteriales bacterium]|nr:MAG: DUF3494 domain-containing protein [Flavobacteriales bacterium]